MIPIKSIGFLTLVILGFSTSTALWANEFTLGVGASYVSSPYKQYDADYLPFPLIKYDSPRIYINGLKGGVYLYNGKKTSLGVDLSYMPIEFDPDNTDNRRLKKLDHRRSTAMLGLSLNHDFEIGTVDVSASTDILGKSNGALIYADYALPIPVSDKLTITPKTGVIWASENYNDYYYGISQKESRRSGLKSYHPESSISPYLGISAHVKFTKNWSGFASGTVTFLPSEVKDSPMVDESSIRAISVGTSYTW